jgi:hypothetical protein
MNYTEAIKYSGNESPSQGGKKPHVLCIKQLSKKYMTTIIAISRLSVRIFIFMSVASCDNNHVKLPVSAKIILTVSAIALFCQKWKSYDSRFYQKPFPAKKSLEPLVLIFKKY